jgi:hypothetical protein
VLVAGFTQASRVIPVVRLSAAELGTVTRDEVPLNASAPPNLPDADQAAPETVPSWPFPESSGTTVPVPWLKL